jgi:hypothetical protein
MSSVPCNAAGDDLARLREELVRQFTMAGPAPCRPIAWTTFRSEVEALYRPPLRAKATFVKMVQVLNPVGELIGPDATTEALTPMRGNGTGAHRVVVVGVTAGHIELSLTYGS